MLKGQTLENFLSKLDETGIRRHETAPVDVEFAQMRVEVYMQPFAARGLGVRYGLFDEQRGVTLTPQR